MALSKITNASVADTAVHGRRNILLNGAMQVNQRGDATGKTTSGFYACDRFQTVLDSSGTFSISQSTEAPDGFKNSMKLDCTTADSSPNYLVIYYQAEGQDVVQTEGGTANAKKLTLSFWVRSNKTGTYQVNMRRYDSGGAERLLGLTYTIDAADTWEKKIVNFIGDTGGNATRNNTSTGILLEWWLASGSTFNSGTRPTAWETTVAGDRAADLSVNIGASTDDEFYLTGVQLEVGDVATPFEYRSLHDERLACMRYYEGTTYSQASANGYPLHVWALQEHSSVRAFPTRGGTFMVPKRATPTIRIDGSQTGTTNELSGYSNGVDYTVSSVNGTTTHSVCGFFQMTDAPPTNQHIVCMIEADAEI